MRVRLPTLDPRLCDEFYFWQHSQNKITWVLTSFESWIHHWLHLINLFIVYFFDHLVFAGCTKRLHLLGLFLSVFLAMMVEFDRRKEPMNNRVEKARYHRQNTSHSEGPSHSNSIYYRSQHQNTNTNTYNSNKKLFIISVEYVGFEFGCKVKNIL